MLGARIYPVTIEERVMKIFDIMEMIWTNPKISEDELLAGVQSLSREHKQKLGALHKIISDEKGNGDNLDKILSNCEHLFSNVNNLFADHSSPDILRDILVAFYLSEYRLDDYAYYPSHMKHKLFDDILEQWHLKKDLIMPIYIHWGNIKHSLLSA